MEQYRICYTVNGEGYTKVDPWIYDVTHNVDDATELLAEALDWAYKLYSDYDVWVESREVTPWQKVDLC